MTRAVNVDAVALADEQAAELRYRAAVRRQNPRPRVADSGRRGLRPAGPRPDSDGLIGRVLLDRTSDIFDGSEFYIGLRYVEDDGLRVFSWTAPIACTFYQGAHHHEHCPHVTTRRTLRYRSGSVVGYIDEHDRPSTTGFGARKLAAAPGSRRRALPGKARPESTAAPDDGPAKVTVPAPCTPTKPPARRAARKPEPSALRAAEEVQAVISAPRQERLGSVLRTLQPDQYHLVTADPAESLIVHGPPGSGKTIVAAHRAAFLVNDDPGKGYRPCRRVLIVGPTVHYVNHIRGVIQELVENSSKVQSGSLDAVMLHLRGLAQPIDEGLVREDRDVDVELLGLAQRAAEMLRVAGHLPEGIAHEVAVERVYVTMRANQVAGRPVESAPGWNGYLRCLPEFRSAVTSRRFLPLLAACSVAVRGSARPRYDHVVVDEAQDVTKLEWALLRHLNSGGWTVLGDRAQRRSDHSCRTWVDVRDEIAQPSARIESVENGYRTASAIMEFASQLLPASERTVRSLQTGGTPPRKVRVTGGRTTSSVAAQNAVDMLAAHSDWSVAVISMKPATVVADLRARGWVIDRERADILRRAGKAIRVLNPHDARGLEFDGVVVVEPAAFPTRMGRHGLLYTSLTRANRELAIVYSLTLPAALRR